MEHQHATGHVAGAIADGGRRAFDIQLIAVAPDEEHRPHRLDRANAPDGNAQRIFERLAGLFVKGTEDLLDRTPHGVLETPAGQLFRNRVDVVDGRMSVSGDDAVADRLQSDLRALLLPE